MGVPACLTYMVELLQTVLQFLAEQSREPLARGLQLDAYLMVPAQRIARYPLLLQAVLDNMESGDPQREQTQRVQQLMKNMVCQCNEHLRVVEEQQALLELENSLDFRKFESFGSRRRVYEQGRNRSLVKRGHVVLTKVQKGKVMKGREVELILLSDMVICAKPVKARKGARHLAVIAQVPRSFVSSAPMPDLCDRVEGQHLMVLTIVKPMGASLKPTTETLYLRTYSLYVGA